MYVDAGQSVLSVARCSLHLIMDAWVAGSLQCYLQARVQNGSSRPPWGAVSLKVCDPRAPQQGATGKAPSKPGSRPLLGAGWGKGAPLSLGEGLSRQLPGEVGFGLPRGTRRVPSPPCRAPNGADDEDRLPRSSSAAWRGSASQEAARRVTWFHLGSGEGGALDAVHLAGQVRPRERAPKGRGPGLSPEGAPCPQPCKAPAPASPPWACGGGCGRGRGGGAGPARPGPGAAPGSPRPGGGELRHQPLSHDRGPEPEPAARWSGGCRKGVLPRGRAPLALRGSGPFGEPGGPLPRAPRHPESWPVPGQPLPHAHLRRPRVARSPSVAAALGRSEGRAASRREGLPRLLQELRAGASRARRRRRGTGPAARGLLLPPPGSDSPRAGGGCRGARTCAPLGLPKCAPSRGSALRVVRPGKRCSWPVAVVTVSEATGGWEAGQPREAAGGTVSRDEGPRRHRHPRRFPAKAPPRRQPLVCCRGAASQRRAHKEPPGETPRGGGRERDAPAAEGERDAACKEGLVSAPSKAIAGSKSQRRPDPLLVLPSGPRAGGTLGRISCSGSPGAVGHLPTF